MDEGTNQEETSIWAMGILMAVFCITGLVLASGARDDGMYVFGWSLTAFAVAFIGNLMRISLANAGRSVKAHDHG